VKVAQVVTNEHNVKSPGNVNCC